MEIAVNHFIDDDKKNFFIQNRHRTIEIDLSKMNKMALREEIEQFVIHETNNKSIIYWESNIKDSMPENKKKEIHLLALITLLISAG
jgi:hypothetical protein